MTIEVFSANRAATTVTSGGTTAPSAGTHETWTVASASGFPVAASAASGVFHVADPAAPTEIIPVIGTSGTTWTVIRGGEGTTPVAHAAGFTVWQDVTAGYLGSLAQVVNVRAPAYGARGDGTTDDTSAINAAISAAAANPPKTVYIPGGTYYLSSALSLATGVSIAGDGMGSTNLVQHSTTAHGLSGTDISQVTLRDFQVTGPSSGSGNGINIVPSSNDNVAYIDITNVLAGSWGNTGVHLDTPIVTHLRKVIASSNGGDGFQFSNTKATPTSLSLDSCYANSNGFAGYELDGVAYSALNGCASDANSYGYALYSCAGVTLSGCGAERFTSYGWVFDGCSGCHLNGAWTYSGKTVVAWVTDGTTGQTITGLVETSPASGATASIKTDSGTSSVIVNPALVTSVSYASGTAYVITGTGGTAH